MKTLFRLLLALTFATLLALAALVQSWLAAARRDAAS
jgi:hypothetical protein